MFFRLGDSVLARVPLLSLVDVLLSWIYTGPTNARGYFITELTIIQYFSLVALYFSVYTPFLLIREHHSEQDSRRASVGFLITQLRNVSAFVHIIHLGVKQQSNYALVIDLNEIRE